MVKRYLAVAQETAYGTYVVPTPGVTTCYAIVSETLRGNREFLMPETVADRFPTMAIEGPIREAGDIVLFPNSENIGKFLKWLVGQVTTVDDGSGHYKHTFVSTDSIPSFTSEIGHIIDNARQIGGCFVTSLALEAVARELVTATIGVTAKKEKIVTNQDPAQNTFSVKKFFSFKGGTVKIADVAVANVEAFRVTYENSVDTDAFALGDQFLPYIALNGYKVTGSMDLNFNVWDNYRRWLGAASNSEFTDQTPISIQLDCVGEALGGVGDYANHLLRVEMPVTYWRTADANLDRRERVVQTVEFEAIKDLTIGAPIRYTVCNGQATP